MSKPANWQSTLATLTLGGLLALPTVALATGEVSCLKMLKEVSVDGGFTWHDADTEAEALQVTNGARYKIYSENCGTETLTNIMVTDPLLGISMNIDSRPTGKVVLIDQDAPDICADRVGLVKNTATVVATGMDTGTYLEANDDAWVNCGIEPPPEGGEGCTPGYWKQPQHFDSWPSEYAPGTLFSSVFGRNIAVRVGRTVITNPTLLQALRAQGGNVNAAARHTVAALLNASSTGVDYDMTSSAVIELFQENYPDGELDDVKDLFEHYNEQGCPLN